MVEAQWAGAHVLAEEVLWVEALGWEAVGWDSGLSLAWEFS